MFHWIKQLFARKAEDYLKRRAVQIGAYRFLIRELTLQEFLDLQERFAQGGSQFNDIVTVVALACEQFHGMAPEKINRLVSADTLAKLNKEILKISKLIGADDDEDIEPAADKAPEDTDAEPVDEKKSEGLKLDFYDD